MNKLFLIILLSLAVFANDKFNIKLTNYTNTPKDYVYQNDKIKLNANGKTIECSKATPGSFEKLENTKYYIAIDKNDLLKVINKYRLDDICTTHVTDMSYLFYLKNINANIGSWDTSNVTNMEYMFYENKYFDNDISYWDTSKVTNTSYMFYGADSFDQNINNWDISNVLIATRTFYFAKSFNQNLSKWNTNQIYYADEMFSYAESFNQDISNWKYKNLKSYKDFDLFSPIQNTNYTIQLI